MATFQFPELKLKDEQSIKKQAQKKHLIKTALYTLGGALAGYLLFYVAQGSPRIFWSQEAIQNMAFGAFYGIFITNSPCARGRC